MKQGTQARISAICPICGTTYHEHPALSRTDGESQICPDCGIRQALDSIGITVDEQNKILKTIHKTMR